VPTNIIPDLSTTKQKHNHIARMSTTTMLDRQLIVAAENGRTEEIKRILETSGADAVDVNARDIGGWSALQWASATGHVETARLLLDHGASVNTKTNLVRPLICSRCRVCCLLSQLNDDLSSIFNRCLLSIVARENDSLSLTLALCTHV
jgi:hypothetical protein